MTDLHQQTVVVVGASSGIGLATSEAVAALGANIVMVSRTPAKLDDAVRAVGARARAVPMDMLAQTSVEDAFAGIPAIDHLVLTAVADELGRRAPVVELTDEQVERSFDKMRGFVRVIRSAVPLLRDTGSIVLMAGASALKPGSSGFAVLAAESASVIALGKALALELAPRRVNTVVAGVVDTAIHAGHRDDIKKWAESSLPVKRFGEPTDIADAILFLMQNPYVTGQTLIVDGGLTAI
jgi:NAD(P)-dependent dehydrogenase (short-subunit alcohol dehydrogenase family)